MLKKLIKHEWKSTSKIGCIGLLAIVGITLIGLVGIVLPLNYIENVSIAEEDTVFFVFLTMAMVMSIFFYIFALMGVSFGVLIYMGVRFYKTMYSDEGYLTHTLPVTPKQLLLSKTLIAGLWYFLSTLGIVLSVVALIWAAFGSLGGLSLSQQWALIGDMMGELLRDNEEQIFFLIHGIVYVLAMVIVTPFSTMMILFGSFTVGQLSRKYKALMGILVYFGVAFANSILCNVVKYLFMVWAVLSVDNPVLNQFFLSFGSYDIPLLVSAGIAIALYFISGNILTRKLNLE